MRRETLLTSSGPAQAEGSIPESMPRCEVGRDPAGWTLQIVPGSAPQPHLEAGARREQLLLQAQNQLLQEFANNTWNSGKFHPGG